MATNIKEKFDGFKPNFTATARNYDCTYTFCGTATQAEFPTTLQWRCLGIVDTYARLIGISNIVQLGPNRFEATLSYSTDPASTGQHSSKKDPPFNPLARPVVRSWDIGYVERMEDRDLSGTSGIPYQASNGEPYPDGLPIRYPYLIKGYVRNEPFFNETTALGCAWHMDSTRKILCAKFTGRDEFTENGVDYVPVTYEFWKLPSGGTLTWDVVKLDCGSYSNDTSVPPKRIYPKDEDGTKALVTGAVVLDGTGQLGSISSPVWNTFQVHLIANFSSLALPGL